jgi:hypothetical protein
MQAQNTETGISFSRGALTDRRLRCEEQQHLRPPRWSAEARVAAPAEIVRQQLGSREWLLQRRVVAAAQKQQEAQETTIRE